MNHDSKLKFDGFEWLKKRNLYISEWKRKMELMEEKVRDKVVLDAGCGTGYETHYLSNFAKEIHGLDINGKNIEEAKRKYSADNLFFHTGNVESMPFKDSTFDVIISCFVIEHLNDPEKFIDESYRVIKPQGNLIIWVPNVKNMMGIFAKIIPLNFENKIKSILYKMKKEEVIQYECFYKGNSVRKLDKLSKINFKRTYLERFDTPVYFRYSRILFYLWYLRHKLSNNKFLNWLFLNFYVEWVSLKED